MAEFQPAPSFQIRRVYASNLLTEFKLIDDYIDRYPNVAIDTEFPGVCFKSPKPFWSLSPRETYESMKANIDKMQIIQLGLVLFDTNGNLAGTFSNVQFIWEFNFKDFDIRHDLCDLKSIDLLLRKGIDFDMNSQKGIDSSVFAKNFMESRLYTCPLRNWVTFHGAYDFGYLVKVLNHGKLPNSIEEFLGCLRLFCGSVIFDMKQMMYATYGFTGGLEKLAKSLSVERLTGESHQAGSDCLLTALTFTEMMKKLFREDYGAGHVGALFGLDVSSEFGLVVDLFCWDLPPFGVSLCHIN